MDVYIARQPIFDRRMNIIGYELLYRNSAENHFTEMDDDLATAELIYHSFMVIGLHNLTDGKKAFINFSKGLVNSDVPFLLPRTDVVIELLEREQATQETVDACNKLRSLGYRVALDDCIYNSSFLPLIGLVDLVKVEYPSVRPEDQKKLIQRIKKSPGIKLLAEKIETREEYQRAVALGYDYFQGYFFSKPTMVRSRDIVSFQANLFHIMEELSRETPRFPVIAALIQGDLGLSYKLLILANSAYIGARHKIQSIFQALTFIGTRELYQWISIMLLKDIENEEMSELTKLSLVRGRLMESMARELGRADQSSEYFFTGMFSFLDVLLNRPMEELLQGLPFTDRVKQALLGQPNEPGLVLHAIAAFESADWPELDRQPVLHEMDSAKFMGLYTDAIKWARQFYS